MVTGRHALFTWHPALPVILTLTVRACHVWLRPVTPDKAISMSVVIEWSQNEKPVFKSKTDDMYEMLVYLEYQYVC